jgi:hypothetical protein
MSFYELGAAEQNQIRARWAATALEAFGAQTGQTGYFDAPLSIRASLLREIAGDFLGNLFHLARINGVEPEEITEAAYAHFAEEVTDEERETEEENAVLDFRNHGIEQLEELLKGETK